jgi:glycogen operon protein
MAASDGAPMREDDWRAAGATLVVALYAEGDRVIVVLHRGLTKLSCGRRLPGQSRQVGVQFGEGRREQDIEKFSVWRRALSLLVEERRARRSSAPAWKTSSRVSPGGRRRGNGATSKARCTTPAEQSALLAQVGFRQTH